MILFLQRYSPPVLIDEIQYAPELFDFIKIYVDENKSNGDFWLTGSQTFHLMNKVTQSLAGRVGVARILGLSNSEILGEKFSAFSVSPDILIDRISKIPKMNIREVYERIFKGSMPRLYEVDNISRDVKELSQVANETAFLNFIGAVAARTASNVNYETLANEVGISATTAKKWLSVLVSAGIVILIQPFTNNALKRIIKSPRMYFADKGLCSYITRWSSPEVLESGAMDGQFFETWVVTEIYKSYINNGKRPPLYFYRDSNKKEIDIIIHQDGIVNPIKIKKSTAPKCATKNFSVLKPIEKEPKEGDEPLAYLKTKVGLGAVICMTSDIIPIDKKNWYIPPWLI